MSVQCTLHSSCPLSYEASWFTLKPKESRRRTGRSGLLQIGLVLPAENLVLRPRPSFTVDHCSHPSNRLSRSRLRKERVMPLLKFNFLLNLPSVYVSKRSPDFRSSSTVRSWDCVRASTSFHLMRHQATLRLQGPSHVPAPVGSSLAGDRKPTEKYFEIRLHLSVDVESSKQLDFKKTRLLW